MLGLASSCQYAAHAVPVAGCQCRASLFCMEKMCTSLAKLCVCTEKGIVQDGDSTDMNDVMLGAQWTAVAHVFEDRCVILL